MNIFEGITKEKFIEEFNKDNNGSLSLLHINLAFDYKGLKKSIYKYSDEIKLRSITNIKNYEAEIEVFNSFKPFLKYEDKGVLIIDNYNKYLSHRSKIENELVARNHINYIADVFVLKLGKHTETKGEYFKFKNVETFNKFIKAENTRKSYNSIVKELNKSVEEYSDKILLFIKERLVEFEDEGYIHEFIIKFPVFENLEEKKKITKQHLIKNNFFDEFELTLKGRSLIKTFCKSNTISVDDYLNLHDDFMNIMKYIGESLGYNITLDQHYHFIFKKK
ncbi:hypothetical protein OA93_04555 [Flavobacterium sp. KMS]|uniref:hypothetical protein n=1 Tax=Flavobacterium sp. KMS TaxID=1566023 RepID=UPI00057C4C64|nr:hypothetical protein [Flavobacterium sp. KMS]KIA99442.1 hypothetical protein OA93_04555 [Flavobacterium sp. KMS]